MNKTYISTPQVQGLVSSILRQLAQDSWRPDYVVGLTRGGLIPAVMISQYLDVPMHTLKISFRDGEDTESNCWMAEDAYGYATTSQGDSIQDEYSQKKILIVDDINDSGATLNWIMDDWQASCHPGSGIWDHGVWGHNVRFAVLYDNLASQCREKVSYVGQEINKVEDPCWIVFPWECWWSPQS
jgi:uncharacterized protein